MLPDNIQFEIVYAIVREGVPIESVRKILGHKSLKTTQIYAKFLDKKGDMEDLEIKLNNPFSVANMSL